MVSLGHALVRLTLWVLWPVALLALAAGGGPKMKARPARGADALRIEGVAWIFTLLGVAAFHMGKEFDNEIALVAGASNVLAGMVLNAWAVLCAAAGGLRREPVRRLNITLVASLVLAVVQGAAYAVAFYEGRQEASLVGTGTVVKLISVAVIIGLFHAIWQAVARPLTERERARLFVDLLETCVANGQDPAQAIARLSEMGDATFGADIQKVAEKIGDGERLVEALRRTDDFLPRELTEMLAVAEETGDLAAVLPACRKVTGEHVSRTRSAFSYVLMVAPIFNGLVGGVLFFLMVFILKKFERMTAQIGMLGNLPLSLMRQPFYKWALSAAIFLPVVLVLVLSSRSSLVRRLRLRWLVDRIAYRTPWRRMRMQRDLSAMLAVLLDAGVPEARALEMAAASTANRVFVRRASSARAALAEGEPLVKAVMRLDDSGELEWRLASAAGGSTGFSAALDGWHESLDAKAFRAEQAFTHVVTTLIVTVNGAVVAVVAFGVFGFLNDMIVHMMRRF